MGMRRFTRLTNGFSKKAENHAHAVALHYMHYNFGRIHKTLRVTPAMEAGVADHVWTMEEIAALMDVNYTPKTTWSLQTTKLKLSHYRRNASVGTFTTSDQGRLVPTSTPGVSVLQNSLTIVPGTGRFRGDSGGMETASVLNFNSAPPASSSVLFGTIRDYA